MRLLTLFVGVLAIALSHCEEDLLSVTPESITVTFGQSQEFLCRAAYREDRSLSWTKEVEGKPTEKKFNATITTHNDTHTLFSTLTISEVDMDDSASYHCSDGQTGAIGKLIVTYDGLVDIKGSRVIKKDQDMNLTCFIDGDSSTNVTWKKSLPDEIVTLPNAKQPNIEVQGSTLLIKKPSIENNAGTYTCSGKFGDVDVNQDFVLGGEIVIKAPASTKFTEGERARFECIAIFPEGDPEPTFKWVVNTNMYNTTITEDNVPDNRFSVEGSKRKIGSVLHMLNVVKEDRGNYTCIVKSSVTEVTHTIFLRVRDRLAALWPFIGIMSEVILLIIIIFIHEKCTAGEDFGEEDEDEEEVAEPIKEKEKISLDGEGDMRMRSSNQ